MLTRTLIFTFLITTLSLYAQKGPGGVSVESGSQSTCRAWLDASTLTTLADGDDLTDWPDISPSTKNDKATPKSLAPYFRDDPANTINGYPVVTFEDGRFLLMQSTTDLNLNSVTHSKTVFFAFRTSTDVTSRQVLFEEGGCWRGFNVYIENNNIHVGAYDLNDDGLSNDGVTKDSDGTPQFGYTFVKKQVDANNTYILSVQFYAENTGIVDDDPDYYYIKGWLNGQVFDVMDKTTGDHTQPSVGNDGIGTLFKHPNPIGLGAANDDIVIINGAFCSNTGDFSFQGRLAEVLYYNDRLTETQRIIIENYLGAKYFANFIVNDKYDHQASYGVEVIGIGQQSISATNRHNLSQGRNPFLISASPSTPYDDADQYFFTGHNGAGLTLTSSGVPNNSPVIQRLQRTWRVDERGTFESVRIKIDSDDIPAAPSGYSKLVLLVDTTSVNFPNFSLASTVVKEIPVITGTTHQVDYDFADNAFYTFAWLKPQVEFAVSESSALEADAPAYSAFTVPVTLNYQPVSPFANTVDYIFVDAGQTAESADYQYSAPAQTVGLSIDASQSKANLSLDIINDNIADDESTEQFLIILQSGSNTTSGLEIGERDTLVFYILDDDPPPTGSFVTSFANISEAVDSVYIKVRRTGDPSDMFSTASKIRIRRKASPNEGTATYNTDYGLLSVDNWKGSAANRVDTVSFAKENTSSQVDSIKVMITDDLINEANETVYLILEGAVDIAIDSSSITGFQLNIIEDDPLPEATFLTDNQAGYESLGAPVVLAILDRPSSRDVTLYYSIDTDASTADYESDYTGATSGSILFEAGDTLGFPSPFYVDNGDLPGEPDQTVIFHLDSAINATIGAASIHTYTIIDYAPFEWLGAAGVGKNADNIVWVDANRMSPTGIKTAINNFSPRDIDITRKGGDNNRATLISSGINNRQSIEFDGIDNSANADVYKIDDDSFINLAGTSERKAFFFVIEPTAVPSVTAANNATPTASNCRILYEEGGNSRGISVYFYDSKLYFHAWNYPPSGGRLPDENLWGYNSGAANNAARVASSVYARSAQDIDVDTPYIISCIYDELSDEPLMVYVNGRKGVMSGNITAPGDVGKLYGHSGDIGLGGYTNGGLLHFTVKPPGEKRCPFKGLLSEMIMFQEPQLNDARRTIIENYLSAKYDISLYTSDTRQIFDLSYADLVSDPTNAFNNDVAGIGQIITLTDTLYHGDAQGTSILRIKDAIFTANEAFLEWGHNGKALTDTWEYSYWNADLPEGIEERSGLVWKLFESPNGTVTSADIYINFSASANASSLNDTTYLKLLVNTTSDKDDFSSASVYNVAQIKSGNVAFFDNVPISNGAFITLGNTSPITLFPLPIELLNFDAKFEVDHVNITWATGSEINNEYFEIERAGTDLNWKAIAHVAGAGNSNTTLYYNEKDSEPLLGISYYRLKQIDYDGKFKYSDVVSVANNTLENGDEVFIYPNPVSGGNLIIRIPYALSDSKTIVQIYDLTGKSVHIETLTEGNLLSEIQVDKLHPGAYFIHIHSALLDETKKLIVN